MISAYLCISYLKHHNIILYDMCPVYTTQESYSLTFDRELVVLHTTPSMYGNFLVQ